jgi:hypothetical protein
MNNQDSDFKIDLKGFIQPLFQPLQDKHTLVARKLFMSVA